MSVTKNAIALYGAQGINYIAGLAALPIITRSLGLESYSKYAALVALAQIALVLVDYGYNLSATRQIAEKHAKAEALSTVFWETTYVKLLLFALVAFAAALTGPNYIKSSTIELTLVIGVAAASTIVFPIWFFQGTQSIGTASIITSLAKIASLVAIFYLVEDPSDYLKAAIIPYLFVIIAGIIWLITEYPTPSPPHVKTTISNIRDSLRFSFPFFIGSVATQLYTTVFLLIVSQTASAQIAGAFAIGQRLVYLAQSMISPIVQATYPKIAAMQAENDSGLAKLKSLVFRVQLLISFAASAFLLIFATQISIILFGESSTDAISAIRWLSPIIPIGAASYFFGIQSLIPLGKQKEMMYTLLVLGTVGLLGTIAAAETFGSTLVVFTAGAVITEACIAIILGLLTITTRRMI